MNDKGQVVGDSGAPSGDAAFHAVSWTRAGGMIDLGTLGGLESIAVGVNESGEVIGDSYLPISDPQLGPEYHAVLWRPIANLGCRATLSRCDLRGINLAGAHLRERNLSDANLKGTILVRANLKGANLKGADLKDASLIGANLSGANLKDVTLKGASLTGANLTDVDLRGANLKDANLTNADLFGARLKGANVKDVVWANTICPDGTNSNANGGTCVGHF